MIAIVTTLTYNRMHIKNIDGFSSIKLILNRFYKVISPVKIH